MGRMKAPSKSQLREVIASLTKQNLKLVAEKEAEERKRWRDKTGDAYQVLCAMLKERFGYSVYMTRLDHIDKSGYWFQFNLVNDERLQTYCVRHDEV